MLTALRSFLRPVIRSAVQNIRCNSLAQHQEKARLEPLIERLLFSRTGPVSSLVRVGEDEKGFFVERCVYHSLAISKNRKYYASLESADQEAQQIFEELKKPLGPAPSIDS